MKLISRLLSVIVVLGTVAALCLPADAGAYVYAGKRKKVYCGIVEIIDPANPGVALNSPAYTGLNTNVALLFAKLDAMNNMKPSGWTFENPLTMSRDKLDPTYWLVRISSARDLSRMNVLYLPGSGILLLSDKERENLRRFVDGGGVLWVDNAGGTSALDFDGTFFIPQLSFKTPATGVDFAGSRHHPLLCSPFWLTDMEIMNVGTNALGETHSYCDMGLGSGIPSTMPLSFDILYPIIDMNPGLGASSQPAVVANAYGSGRVVATANFVGKGCVAPEPYSLPSLKFAFNIMAYASTWTDLRKNPRHSGTSIDTLGSNRLVEKWSLPHPPTVGIESGPLLYKNTVFYTSGSTLYALEQNGDTNNGLYERLTDGAVVIWSWTDTNGATLSSPTIATMQNPDPDVDDFKPTEAVIVMNTAGIVYVLRAFPLNAIGQVVDTHEVPTNSPEPIYSFETAAGAPSGDSKWPSPPIYINGWLYAVGGNGKLYADNPYLRKWVGGTHTLAPGFQEYWECPPKYPSTYIAVLPKGGPSFGFVKNQSSGAVAGMVYWFTAAPTATPSGPPVTMGDINDHICGIPVSVSMDRVTLKGTNGVYEVAVNYVNPIAPGYLTAPNPVDSTSAIRITMSNGNPIPGTVTVMMNEGLAGPAPGRIKITGDIPSDAIIYASYSISYSDTQADRLDLEIEPKSPDMGVSHSPTLFTGTPAMGPDNMIYMTANRASQTSADGGSILAYQSDGGPGSTAKLKWHYFMHSGASSADGSGFLPGMDVTIPGVIYDPPVPADTGIGRSMIDPQPGSSPAVVDGKVFVTVSGKSGGPMAALVCLKANPEFVIRLTENAGFDRLGDPILKPKSLYRKNDHGKYTIKLWQPNIINTPSTTVPLIDARPLSGGVNSGVNIDWDNGTITFSDFSITKLQQNSVNTNTFSPSLPVWVWLDNVEVAIDWTKWKPKPLGSGNNGGSSDLVDLSGWNNMLWTYIVPNHTSGPCSGVHSPPIVIGNAVYFICDDGVLYALDTETGISNAENITPEPIWTQQLGSGTSFPDNTAISVAGANGVLLAPGPDGLHAFTNTTTLVADSNRLVELDGAGEVTWSVDSIKWPAAIPPTTGAEMAIKQGPVNKPSRARYASTGEILFANSGANQVCKIDKSGTVGFEGTSGQYVRWIYDNFTDPRHLLRPGQPLELRSPTDALMWQEMEPPPSSGSGPATPGVSVVHCIIADSGNSRILDLVYRVTGGRFVKYDGITNIPDNIPDVYIDAGSGFVLPELNWVSKTDSLNERYVFDCIQLVPSMPNGADKFVQDIWVASSNYASTGTGGDSPKGAAGLGGAILAIGYRERTLGSNGTAPGLWSYNAPTSGTITARCDHIELDGTVVPLANPRFFDVLQPDAVAGIGMSLMVCDNYGVYRAELIAGGTPIVRARLLEKEYRDTVRNFEKDPSAPPIPPASAGELNIPLPIPFMPTCVQRLQNGHWLITNNYSGTTTSGAITFGGEVFEYDGKSTTPEQYIPWSSPRLQRLWVGPSAGGSWGAWKQITTNTYNLKQPKSAFRPQ